MSSQHDIDLRFVQPFPKLAPKPYFMLDGGIRRSGLNMQVNIPTARVVINARSEKPYDRIGTEHFCCSGLDRCDFMR